MNKDLTVGKPSRVLWQFCLPLFASVIFQQLYNLADSWVAGRFIGEGALASVGNSYEITLIFIALSFGCNIGCSVVVSRHFGAGDYRGMKTAVSTAMLFCAGFVVLLMLIGILGSNALLHLIKTPDDLLADSKLYLDVYVWGLPFVFFYNIANGIFSAMGDSKTPFWFLAVSSLSNIGMDVWFVVGLQMGVAGVAWATFICQGVSCCLSLFFVFRRLHAIHTDEKPALFSKKALVTFLGIAVPSMIQQSFVSVGNIVVQSVINAFGKGVMAGYSAGVKLNNLAITSFVTVSNGMSNYASQNVGAQKPERLRSGFWAGVRMIWCLCLPITAVYLLFPRAIIGFFLKEPSVQAMESGVHYLRILSPCYCIIAGKLIADGILRGCSHMKEFMTDTFTDLILRVVLSFVFSATALGSTGIWLSWPVGWILATVLALFFVFRFLGRVCPKTK